MLKLKEPMIRSKPYRQLVASLPCSHCGRWMQSQAAHENAGKGKGGKVGDDRTFPMCHEFAGGCHAAYDQYRLVVGRQAHIELGRLYVARTHAALRELAREDRSARAIVDEVIGL